MLYVMNSGCQPDFITYNITMKKKKQTKTLGLVSSELISRLMGVGKEIFTISDASEYYGKSKKETSDLLSDLVNRGILSRIKSGVFIILKTGQESIQLRNWPLIAVALVGEVPYFLSHYSAMRLHGMTIHPLTRVFISIPKRRNSKKIQEMYYDFIYIKPSRFWGICEMWVTKHEKVYISDLERTILDGLERPELCGGIKEVIRGIWAVSNKVDGRKLLRYAKKYDTISAVKRLGFILETFNFDFVSLDKIANIVENKNDYVMLDPNLSKFGKHLKRWRIQINIDIDELKSSIWG